VAGPTGRVEPARHLADNYLDFDFEEDESVRPASYQRLVDEEKRVKALPEKYRRYIPEEQKLMDLNARAHAVHDERVRQAG
jgi:tellurite resistance protein TerC